jgi:hypothetical protein
VNPPPSSSSTLLDAASGLSGKEALSPELQGRPSHPRGAPHSAEVSLRKNALFEDSDTHWAADGDRDAIRQVSDRGGGTVRSDRVAYVQTVWPGTSDLGIVSKSAHR